MSIMVYIKI